MKKVLMCYHSAQYGGVEFQILDIISGLSKEFEFTVACPQGPLVEEYKKAGAKWIELYPHNEFDIGYVMKIKKYVKENKIDIVHAHELRSGVLAIIGAFFGRAKKRIYHVHTPFIFWQYSYPKKLFALPVNWYVNFLAANFFATDVLALTPYIKRIRTRTELVNSSKISIIPNAVRNIPEIKDAEIHSTLKKYDIDDSDFILGYVARFSAEKGHSLLIEAFSSLVAEKKLYANSKLLLVGGGDLLDECKLLVKTKNIETKVVFTGRVEDTEKFALLKRMNIFVFPTLAEGFGISLIEAMRMRVPVLASDLPVLKDVGRNGICYFEKGDDVSMAQELVKLINMDSNRRQELVNRAYKVSQEYSLEKFWDNYKKLYGGKI